LYFVVVLQRAQNLITAAVVDTVVAEKGL